MYNHTVGIYQQKTTHHAKGAKCISGLPTHPQKKIAHLNEQAAFSHSNMSCESLKTRVRYPTVAKRNQIQ